MSLSHNFLHSYALCYVLHRGCDIKAILLYECRWKRIFHTNAKFKGTQSFTQRTHTRGTQHTYMHTHTHNMQDLPRHQHSDPRLSVSFQSQTRWMAGEWKSWLKPNPIPLLPSTVRERPSILFATTLMPRGPPPPRYSTLRSRIILLRVFLTLPKIQIYQEDSLYIYNIFQRIIYNYSYICNFIYLFI